MWLALFFGLCGLATLAFGAGFRARSKRLIATATPTPVRAVGLEEQEGGEGGIYYHIVYEIAEGPDSGRRAVSELGHGRPPRLPEGTHTELVHVSTGKVLTGGTLRFLTFASAAIFGAGAISLAAALHLALRAQP